MAAAGHAYDMARAAPGITTFVDILVQLVSVLFVIHVCLCVQ